MHELKQLAAIPCLGRHKDEIYISVVPGVVLHFQNLQVVASVSNSPQKLR